VQAIRKQKKTIKSVSSECDDYEDDFYALELEKNEFELNRLRSVSVDSELKNHAATSTYSNYEESKVNFLINAVSLVIGFQTTIHLIGLPEEFYHYGIQSYQLSLSMLIAPIIIALVFVPFLYELKFKSIYEYIDNKFGSGSHVVKMLTILLVLFFQFFFAAFVLLSSSLAIVQIVAYNPISVLLCTLVLGVSSALLAMLGLKSIIWANFFQFLILIACNLTFIILGFQNLSSNSSIWDGLQFALNVTGRNNLIVFKEDFRYQYTFWNCLIGLIFSVLPSYCLTQQSYQRIKQAKSLTSAKVLVLTVIPVGFINFVIFSTVGMIMISYFYKCGIQQPRELLSSFINQFYFNHKGLVGFYVACLITSTLGTLSSILKGLAATLVEDVFSRMCTNREVQQNSRRRAFWSRNQSSEKADYSYEKELLNLKVNWIPTRKKKQLLKKYAIKHSKKLANKNITLLALLASGLIIAGIANGLELLPGSLVTSAFSLLNVFHGPLLFIFMCARFNHFALKRNHFALNTRSTASRLKNMRIHYVDVVLSCAVSLTLVGLMGCSRLRTQISEENIDFYGLADKVNQSASKECIALRTNNTLYTSNAVHIKNVTNIDRTLSKHDLFFLNYLFAISYNWYPLISLLVCCICLFTLSALRFIYAYFFCCSKSKRSRN